MEQNKVIESEDFLKIKKDFSYLSEAVFRLNKKTNFFLMVDHTGKAIVIYDLIKFKKGFKKNKSASFFHESISDKFYREKFNESEKNKIVNSLIKLISSRLEITYGTKE
jgi:hypothetical protein